MTPESNPTSFICTLPNTPVPIAYHVVVDFSDPGHPECVRFTSFVGNGRRSFRLLANSPDISPAAFSSGEVLCRLAIGQALRDNLCDKAVEGDRPLDLMAPPWEGEMRPVGSRGGGRPHFPRMHG